MSALQVFADEIRTNHEKAQRHAAGAIQHALAAGRLLQQAKAQSRHGEWLPFLESTGINPRSAQRYMRLAANKDRLKCDGVSHLTVTQALEFLAEPKVSPPPAGKHLSRKNESGQVWIWESQAGYFLRVSLTETSDGGCRCDTLLRAVCWNQIVDWYSDLEHMHVVDGLPVEAFAFRDHSLKDVANNGPAYNPLKPWTSPSRGCSDDR